MSKPLSPSVGSSSRTHRRSVERSRPSSNAQEQREADAGEQAAARRRVDPQTQRAGRARALAGEARIQRQMVNRAGERDDQNAVVRAINSFGNALGSFIKNIFGGGSAGSEQPQKRTIRRAPARRARRPAPQQARRAQAAAAARQAAEDRVSPKELVDIGQAAGHHLSLRRAREVAPHLNRAMVEANIDTKKEKAAFIAQLMHESAAFQYNEEIASGAAYEGRRDLGNTRPGDGRRFKGRGFIQLTGRANYQKAGEALSLDLVNNPQLAASDQHAARVAAWYWNSRNLNRYAEAGQFDTVTRRINGGLNGKADRDRLYRAALSVV